MNTATTQCDGCKISLDPVGIMSSRAEFAGSSSRPTSDVVLKGVPVTMTWLDLAELPNIDPAGICGVGVVAFTAEGEIVLVRLRRGVEIPAGKIEPSDVDLEATARREAWEEARIVLGELELTQLMQVDPRDGDGPTTYVVIFSGNVQSMPPFEQCHESSGRVIVSCDYYEKVIGFGTVADRCRLVDQARAAVRRIPAVRTAKPRRPSRPALGAPAAPAGLHAAGPPGW